MATAENEVRLHPFYHQAYNEIVQPDRFVSCSRYFLLHWGPLLGSRAVHLILFLRGHGYYNPHTGERRDAVTLSRKTLAEGMGCSYDSVRRMLQEPLPNDFPGRPDKYEEARHAWEMLRRFVWVEPQADESGGSAYNVYHVAMDDPLIEKDRTHLEEIAARKQQEQEARNQTTEFRLQSWTNTGKVIHLYIKGEGAFSFTGDIRGRGS